MSNEVQPQEGFSVEELKKRFWEKHPYNNSIIHLPNDKLLVFSRTGNRVDMITASPRELRRAVI